MIKFFKSIFNVSRIFAVRDKKTDSGKKVLVNNCGDSHSENPLLCARLFVRRFLRTGKSQAMSVDSFGFVLDLRGTGIFLPHSICPTYERPLSLVI